MMKKIFLLPAFLCLAGCGVFMREPYRETVKYELSLPQWNTGRKTGGVVNTGVFRNLTGAGRKIEFTGSSGRIQALEYVEWAQSPERMIQCVLAGAVSGLPEKTEINGVIWRFSLDKSTKKAYLGVNYEIKLILQRGPAVVKSFRFNREAPLKDATPESAAAAMSYCADQLAGDIVEKLGLKKVFAVEKERK